MLNYKSLEHSDNFETEVIFWIEVTDVPERFVEEAKKIDGEDFLGDGFGVCIQYDRIAGSIMLLRMHRGITSIMLTTKGKSTGSLMK